MNYPHERFLESLGLFGSPWSPTIRGLVAFSGTALVISLIRPSACYTDDGKARPWRKLHNVEHLSTDVPWWLVPLTVGGAAALL